MSYKSGYLEMDYPIQSALPVFHFNENDDDNVLSFIVGVAPLNSYIFRNLLKLIKKDW